MGFKNNGPGCCGCGPPPPCGTIDRTIKGCNSLVLPGATVVLKDSSLATVDTQTSDASGDVSFTGLAADTYSLTITSGRFTGGGVAGLVVTCPSTTLSGVTTLTPSAPYRCRSGCAEPVKKTLTWTTSAGTGTVTAATGAWVGSGTFTSPNTCFGPGTVNFSVSLTDTGGGGFTIDGGAEERCQISPGPTWTYFAAGGCGIGVVANRSTDATVGVTPACTVPFSASGTIGAWSRGAPATCGAAAAPTDDPFTGTVTWSE